MAVLTGAELEEARKRFAATRSASWTKAQINAALQAIETAMTGNANVGASSVKAYVAAQIEAAAPGVFTAQQKDDLGVAWSRLNAERGGIL